MSSQIRSLTPVAWKDPLAWLEPMKGAKWNELIKKEETLKTASEKQEEVKEIIIEKPRESFDSKKSVFDRLKDL